jgi:predicted AlkP superfamily phosphohydrolase/phosphomutase
MGWKFLDPKHLDRIKQLLPFVARWAPEATITLDETVDWDHTQAYSFGYMGQIYVNLEGREPRGIVAPGAEYEHLIEQIKKDLQSWKDPEDGRPVVDAVFGRDELYRGLYVTEAPDLCLIMRDMSYITNRGQELTTQSILGPPLHTGSHRLHGMFMALGEDVKPGVKVESASLVDVAPTILYLMDVPIPGNIDGRVLKEILSTSLTERRPIRRAEGSEIKPSEFLSEDWSAEDEKELIEHLRDLGYLS